MAAAVAVAKEKTTMTTTNTISASEVQTAVIGLLRSKSTMSAAHQVIIEKKIDGIMRELMNGRVMSAAAAAAAAQSLADSLT
jgi:hypothetical protein